MTSSEEVLKRVSVRCSNETCDTAHKHRHIHLIQGRAKAAQVYPRLFGIRVCQGIRAQRRLEELGMRAWPVMTVDQMTKTSPKGKVDECPSEALHEVDCTGMVAVDDVGRYIFGSQ